MKFVFAVEDKSSRDFHFCARRRYDYVKPAASPNTAWFRVTSLDYLTRLAAGQVCGHYQSEPNRGLWPLM